MAVLNLEEAILLEKEALDLGMDVLVETHTHEEVKIANKLKSKLVGVNNRNLKTMKVDINNTMKLKKFIDPDKIIVAESGLKKHSDLQFFKENGIINFLIGESLMREKNLTLATKTILGF
jgi:indole-3-glycerol phosphate synthase